MPAHPARDGPIGSRRLKGVKQVGTGKVFMVDGSPVLAGANGLLRAGTLVIGGRNAMPVNGVAK